MTLESAYFWEIDKIKINKNGYDTYNEGMKMICYYWFPIKEDPYKTSEYEYLSERPYYKINAQNPVVSKTQYLF